MQVLRWLCVFICPLAYSKNVAVAWPFSDVIGICYVFPVLWTTPFCPSSVRQRRRKQGVCSKWLNVGQLRTGGEVWCLRIPCVAYNKFLLFCDCEPNEYGVSLNVTGTRGKGDCAKSKGPDQLLSAWSLVLRRMYSACLCSPSLSVESRHAIFHACTFCNNVDLLQ